MVFERSFFVVLSCLLACLTLSYVLIMGPRSNDNLETPREYGDGMRSRSYDADGLCLNGSICKRKSGSLFYEYRREKTFERRLRHAPKDVTRAVPNLVHFTWFKGEKAYFRFHQLLSIMAVQRAMNPAVYFWYDYMPFGQNWDRLTKFSQNIYFVHRNYTKTNTQQSLTDLESNARYEALLEFGGLAVEYDIFILKRLDQFFDFETTMGAFPSSDITSGIIIAKPWSTVMRKWYLIQRDSHANHGTPSETLTKLALTEGNGIHVETRMVLPDHNNMAYLYTEGLYFDWRKDTLCVKLWIEEHGREHSVEDIKTWNTTVGDIFRYIYFV